MTLNRRSFIALSGMGLTTVLAGCAGFEPNEVTVENLEVTQTEPNVIEVQGQGEVSTEPNQATVQVGVEATDSESASNVVAGLASKSSALISGLTEYGIPEDDIETVNYSVREDERMGQYEGHHSYSVVVSDPDAVGEVIDVMAESGADSLGRVNFGIDEEREDDLYDTAVQRAVDDAREEAMLYAQATGTEIGEVMSISPSQSRHRPIGFDGYALETADAAAPPTEVREGDVLVTASVMIRYRLVE